MVLQTERLRIRHLAEDDWQDLFFSVCMDETMIGYVDAHRSGSDCEIGYCFLSDYHKKGYAKESLLALFRYLREHGVARVTAGTALKNTPSVRLLSALGFQKIAEEQVSFYRDDNGNDIVFTGGIFELKLSEG